MRRARSTPQIKTPFGEMTADTFLGIIVLDALTHTWDLARATGLDDTPRPGAGQHRLRAHPPDGRGHPGTQLRPALEAPEGADEQTRLMAFLGRQV